MIRHFVSDTRDILQSTGIIETFVREFHQTTRGRITLSKLERIWRKFPGLDGYQMSEPNINDASSSLLPKTRERNPGEARGNIYAATYDARETRITMPNERYL